VFDAAVPQVKQSKCRSGYSDLDAAQLQAKEQEAARAAAELLEQLEKEEAAKTAKAAKKKKKGELQQAATVIGAAGACSRSVHSRMRWVGLQEQ
jgi:hypothetical protein